MLKQLYLLLALAGLFVLPELSACSVLYYIDQHTGKIYVVNNEDYWYDVDAFIQIIPSSRNKLGRLWYGWDDFAQGGINEAGLFFDGAVTPEQEVPSAYKGPKGNLGDQILAKCRSVEEAIVLLEDQRIVLSNAHMMIGDSTGYAVVVEWINGRREVVPIQENRLIMTNYLLSDPASGNHPCPRYESIDQRISTLEEAALPVDLKQVGKTMAGAVQPPREIEDGKVGGTLYTSFIGISDMEFVLVYKLNNQKVTKFDLQEEFAGKRKRKIKLL